MSERVQSSLYDELRALDEAHVVHSYARQPVAFVRGEGATLYDVDGEAYLDFVAGIAVCNAGHCHPRVVEAIREQAGEYIRKLRADCQQHDRKGADDTDACGNDCHLMRASSRKDIAEREPLRQQQLMAQQPGWRSWRE